MTSRPGFTIDTDVGRRLIKIVMRGFWDEATIAAYDKALRVAGAQLMTDARCAVGDLIALVDARDLGAQSQNLLTEFKSRFDPPERRPRRTATLVSSALLKRQVERISPDSQRVFGSEREAMEWLLAD